MAVLAIIRGVSYLNSRILVHAILAVLGAVRHGFIVLLRLLGVLVAVVEALLLGGCHIGGAILVIIAAGEGEAQEQKRERQHHEREFQSHGISFERLLYKHSDAMRFLH